MPENKPKFNMGDRVYLAEAAFDKKSGPCPDCKGEKIWHVLTPAGEKFEIDCQTCRRGYFSDGLEHWREWHPRVMPLTIGLIRTDERDGKYEVDYMCEETGIGSGRLYSEEKLFATREEAEEAAKKVTDERIADMEENGKTDKHSYVFVRNRVERCLDELTRVIAILMDGRELETRVQKRVARALKRADSIGRGH